MPPACNNISWEGQDSEMDLTQMFIKINSSTETFSDFGQQIPNSVSPVACQYANTIQNDWIWLMTTANTQLEMLF